MSKKSKNKNNAGQNNKNQPSDSWNNQDLQGKNQAQNKNDR